MVLSTFHWSIYSVVFFECSWAGGHDVLDETGRAGFLLRTGEGNAQRRSSWDDAPNGRVQRKQSQAQWHIVEGQEATDASWNTRNWFIKSKGDQILKQPERLWKLHPWTWPWATRYRSALCRAGICTERLLTSVIERHWIYSRQQHLLKNLKYIGIKVILQLVISIFSLCTFCAGRNFTSTFYLLIISPREQKLGLQTASPEWVDASIEKRILGEIKMWIVRSTSGRFLDRAAENIRTPGWVCVSAERLPGKTGNFSVTGMLCHGEPGKHGSRILPSC